MKQSERVRRITDSADLLERFAAAMTRCTSCRHPDPTHSVIAHIVEAFNGWPGARGYETDRSSGHATTVDEDDRARPTVSDPTGEAAIRRDQAHIDLKELDRRIKRISSDVEALTAIVARYVPRDSTTKQRRETARFNDPGCSSCARLPSPKDPKVNRYEPPHSKTGYPVGDKVVLLCWWCARWLRDTGRIPTVEQLAAHHRGETVRRATILATGIVT